MEKGLVLHKGHSPSSYARDRSASRARPITPHTPSPIDLGRSRQYGIAQSRPIIGTQEGCLSQPRKGAAQMGGCLSLPSKGAHYLVCLLFWNVSILVLITFILHSQSTWTLGSQVQTKLMHKTCNSSCTIHGQIIILFLHNIISQPSKKPYWRERSQVSLWSIGRDVQPSCVTVSWQLFSIRYPVQLVVTKDSGAVAICVTFTF